MLVDILCNIKIEAWIIDEDQAVGLPLHNIFLAYSHHSKDCRKM